MILKLLHNIRHIFLYLTFLYPLYGQTLGATILGIWASACGIIGIVEYKSLEKKHLKYLFPPVALFLVILIHAIIDGSEFAYNDAERSMSLFIIPAAFFFSAHSIKKINSNKLFLLFSVSSLAIVSLGITRAFVDLYQYIGIPKGWPTIWDMFQHPSFFAFLRTRIEMFANLHPTYASIYLGVSSFYFAHELLNTFTENKLKKNILYATLLIYSLILLAFLASRTPFVMTAIGLMILFLFRVKSIKYITIGISSGIALCIITIFSVPSLSQRFSEIKFNSLKHAEISEDNSLTLRQGIMHCSVKIIQENWLWGIGAGNLQNELNNCYEGFPKELAAIYKDKNYNTHNQYLNYWAAFGILGLILIVLFLALVFKTLWRKKKPMGIALFILIAGAMLTENVLSRQHGIIPVLFCLLMLVYSNYTVKQLKT